MPSFICEMCREMVVKALQRVGQGFWDSDGFTKRLKTQDKDLHLWAAEWSREGRIIFQATPQVAFAPSMYHLGNA